MLPPRVLAGTRGATCTSLKHRSRQVITLAIERLEARGVTALLAWSMRYGNILARPSQRPLPGPQLLGSYKGGCRPVCIPDMVSSQQATGGFVVGREPWPEKKKRNSRSSPNRADFLLIRVLTSATSRPHAPRCHIRCLETQVRLRGRRALVGTCPCRPCSPQHQGVEPPPPTV